MRENIEQHLKKVRYFISDNSLKLSAGLFILLLGGLFLTVYQVSLQQEARSRASSPLLSHINCSMPNAESNQDAEEKKLFDLVNNYRKDNGIAELLPDETLDRAAAWQAISMAKDNYFSHTDKLGRTAGKRVVDCGFYGEENQVRENIASGKDLSKAQAVFNGWKKSSIHNETMLDDSMELAGVGRKYNRNSKNGWYWVMDFAIKPNVANVTATTPKPTCVLDDEGDTSAQSVSAGGASVGGGNKKKAAAKKKAADKKKVADNKKKNSKKKKNNKNDKKTDKTEESEEDVTDDDTEGDTDEDCVNPDDDTSDEEDNTDDEDLTPTEEDEDEAEVTEPEAPSLQFAIRIPGSEDLGDIRDATVDFTDLNGKTVATENVEIENFEGDTYIGYLEYGSKLPSGVYKIRVKLKESLRKIIKPDFQKIDATKDIDLPEVFLVMGDFDSNNILNIFDFNIFRNCLDQPLFEEEDVEEETFDDEDAEEFVDEEEESDSETFGQNTRVLASCSQHYEADLNGDGGVDLLDYNLLLDNFQNANRK